MNYFKNLLIKPSEYVFRRSVLTEVISKNKKNNLIILKSSDVQYKTYNIPRIYHQNTYFNYLTGYNFRDATLLIEGNNECFKSTLFIDKQSDSDKLWNGYYPSLEDATKITAINDVFYDCELKSYINGLLKKNSDLTVWTIDRNVLLSIDDILLKKYSNNDVKGILDEMRLHKSSCEIAILKKAGELTNQMFESTMKFSKSKNINEHQIFGKLTFEAYKRGSKLAYPPVIGGGNRANTIHYLFGQEFIQDDELVLVDAGCDVLGYYGDVTRTWPVSGVYSPQQALVYDILNSVFHDCIRHCNSGQSLFSLHIFMIQQLKKYLEEEKVVRKFSNSYCPHYIGHYLGLDIHDSPSVSTQQALHPNTTFTLEPGIYFPKNSPSSNNVAQEFHGIGMRIEDNFYINESGSVQCLNDQLVRSRSEIQRLISDNNLEVSTTIQNL